jgi:iron complex outermembrane recepter protein
MVRRDRFLCTAALSALACMAAGVASAQEAPPSSGTDQEPVQVDDIVVTGSRVIRTGFDAPTPTTVVTSEELNQRGAAQIGEFLIEVPAFRATQTPQANPQSARGAGQYFADLRGLGSIRTLVLVNGRRFVPSSPEGQADLNLIPSLLVDRVDVVTGGASAQWGSDAVAGVVNVILDNDLRGFKGDFSYGESAFGDNGELRASLGWGGEFAGGRGHVVVGGEHVKGDGVASHYDRPWGRELPEQVSYAGTRGADQPSRFFARGVQPLIFTDGGVIIGTNTGVGQPLRGIQFGPGGAVETFPYGTIVGTSAIDFTGGQPGLSIRSGHTLSLPVERSVGLIHVDFEVNDNLTLFAEASWAKAGSDFTTAFARDSTAGAITIQRDNAFLPTAVRNIMLANNILSFSLGRQHKDFGQVLASNFNTTTRYVVGASGAFGDGWTWDAYYQYGENEFRSTLDNLKINANLRFAADAVLVGTSIVCRDVAARNAGCVPINLFGFGSPSPQAIDYVTGTATYDVDTSQEVMAVNVQGTPFSTWAGPVSVAAGVERRVEEAESRVDAISQANGFAYGNPKNFVGSYDVLEGYGEIVAPLLTDLPFAQSVEFNGAYRYTDYSTSGGVSTWKAGLTWQVNDELTFRTTRSRDIRAPNNSDLFAQTTSQVTLRNPFSGATTQMNVVSGGNPALDPEVADTLTIGAVFSPEVVPGLRLSVDYFDIDIADAISAYAAQNVLDNCQAEIVAGAAGFFCGFVTRTGTGAATVINSIATPLLNLSGFRARGFDFEMGYGFDLWGGSVDARLFGTYTRDLISDDGLGVPRTYNGAGVIQTVGSVIDRAGQVGGFTSSSVTGATSQPHLIANASFTYELDAWSITVQQRYIGGGLIDASLVGPDDGDYNPASPISIGDNTVDSRWYTNLSTTYRFDDQLEIYGVVTNLANEAPPFPYTGYVGFYDKVGRNIKVGLRFSF